MNKLSKDDQGFVIIIALISAFLVGSVVFWTITWVSTLPEDPWWWLAAPILLGLDFIALNNAYYCLEVIAKVTSPGYEIQDWPDLLANILRKKKK